MTETHIVDRVRNLSVRVGLFDPGVLIGGSIRPVTNVLENLRVELPLNSLYPLNTKTSKAFVIGSACKSLGVNKNILNCTSPDSRNFLRNHSRIGTQGVNEGVLSTSRNTTSILRIWTGNIDPSDTSVHGSTTQERNLDLLCIKKVGVKSVLSEIVAYLDPSKRVKLANSVLSKIPKFKSLGLPAVDATDIRNIDFSPYTRAKSFSGTRKDNVSPSRLGYTHDFETMSKTTAYHNHIKNSELETREVFERETENIPLTRQTVLVNPLYENPLTRSTDSSKNEERHEPEVNLDPEPSSSDLPSETSLSDSRAKKKKHKKKKKRCKHRKDDSSDPSLSDGSDSSNDSDYRRQRRKKEKHQTVTV